MTANYLSTITARPDAVPAPTLEHTLTEAEAHYRDLLVAQADNTQLRREMHEEKVRFAKLAEAKHRQGQELNAAQANAENFRRQLLLARGQRCQCFVGVPAVWKDAAIMASVLCGVLVAAGIVDWALCH